MLLKINNFNKLTEDEILEKITNKIMKEDEDFINNFMTCSELFKWSYFNGPITKDYVIDILVNYSIKIIEPFIVKFNKTGKWKRTKENVNFVSGGRITALLYDFYVNDNKVFINIEFSTSL